LRTWTGAIWTTRGIRSIRKAIAEFLLAAWVRVNAAIPDFEDRISEAVEMDNS